MKNSKRIFIVLLTVIVISSSIRAQYRWHVVHPNSNDTFHFVSLSCSGENCSALSSNYNLDSNIILHSTDGGLTWNSAGPALPQWAYTWDSKGALLINAIDQIDSLDAIAVGSSRTFIRTFDGWKTWEADTFNFPPVILFHDTIAIGFGGIDFANQPEGVLFDGSDDIAFWTSDSGHVWAEREHSGNIQPYGNEMWREYRAGSTFNVPDTILTTLDNWNTVDTSTFTWNGPFLSGKLLKGDFNFGSGDTLFSFAYRYDSTGTYQILTLVRSTDLGQNWSELSVPQTNRITAPIVSHFNSQNIVVAGEDSTGEILLSSDHGSTWELDTVPLDNDMPYYYVTAIAVTGSGRVVSSITTDSNYTGSTVLAYLEPIPSSVTPTVYTQQNLTLYPNPATNVLTLISPTGTISISDPLGRSYAVPRNGNEMDISTLPPGVYFVSDGVSRAKFVKE